MQQIKAHGTVSLWILVGLLIISLLSTPIAVSAQEEKVTVHLNLKFDLDTLNPLVYSAYTSGTVLSKIYESMFLMSNTGEYIPWLAHSWEITEDTKTYTFHLINNATWHDGEPFTSADVAYTFQACIDGDFHPEVTRSIVNIETPDDYTVVFTLDEPIVTFVWRAGTQMIVPEHIWSEIEDPGTYANDHPLGTGPFTFEKWETEQYVILNKNPNYWQKGKPNIDRIIYHVYTNVEAACMALKAGELDVVENVMPNLAGALIGVPNVTIHSRPVINNRWMGFNFRRYPQDIKEFRQAVSLAIDKKSILTDVLYNFGFLGSDGFLMPVLEYWYNTESEWRGKDLTDEERISEANEILDDLGFAVGEDGVRVTPNGTRLEFDMLTLGSYSTFVRSAEIIKNNLEEVGIKINPVPLETGTVIDMVYYMDFDYDMYMMGCSYARDPDLLFLEFFANPPNPAWTAECQAYSSPELNDLLDLQRKTGDIEERRRIVLRIQEILAEDTPVVTLWHKTYIDAYRTDTFSGWIPEEGIMGILSLINLHLIEVPQPVEVEVIKEVEVTKEVPVTPSWVYPSVGVSALVAIIAVVYATMRRMR